jgi:hypothetical protein
MANKYMKKRFRILGHQGNANQNYIEIPPHSSQNGYYQEKKCKQGCKRKGTLIYCWWEYKLIQPLCKSVWKFFKNLQIELLFDSAIPFLDIYLKESKSA